MQQCTCICTPIPSSMRLHDRPFTGSDIPEQLAFPESTAYQTGVRAPNVSRFPVQDQDLFRFLVARPKSF